MTSRTTRRTRRFKRNGKLLTTDFQPLKVRGQKSAVGSAKRILGIDPGLARIGWGVLECRGDRLKLLRCGLLTTPSHELTPKRLVTIHDAMTKILQQFRPDLVAIERLFFSKNAKTAFAVGQARGVVLLACGEAERPTIEFTPQNVKLALTGFGRADKNQVQRMVRARLRLRETPTPDDVADAIAVAMCAAQSRTADF